MSNSVSGDTTIADARRVVLDARAREVMAKRGTSDYVEAVEIADRELSEERAVKLASADGIALDQARERVVNEERSGADELVELAPHRLEETREQLHRDLHDATVPLMDAEGLPYEQAAELAASGRRALGEASTLPWRDLSPRSEPARPWSDDDWEVDRRRAEYAGLTLERPEWEALADLGVDAVADALEDVRDAVMDRQFSGPAAVAREAQAERVAEAEAKAREARALAAADAVRRAFS